MKSSRILVSALAAILFGVLATPSAQAITTFLLRGKVTDAKTGQPIVGAEVNFRHTDTNLKYKTKTGKDGGYMYRLPWGTYYMAVVMKGYVPQEDPQVRPPQEGDATIKDWSLEQGEGKLASMMTEEEQAKAKKDLEDYKKQQEEYEKYKQMSGEIKALFDEAIALKNAGNFDQAIEKLNEALEKDPKQPNILAHLADAYFQKGDLDAAIANYKKALELNPADGTIHTNLGNVYVKKDMMAEAKAEFDQAVKTDPLHADINYYNMGVVMVNAGKYDEALAAFQKSVAANPNYAPSHYQAAMCLVNKAQYAEAVAEMETYLKLAPTGDYAGMVKQMLPELKKLVGK
jgi:tetratricopeptide (TPR) repeat protein